MMPMPSLLSAACDDAFSSYDALAGLAATPGCRLSCAQPTVSESNDHTEYSVTIAAPGVRADDLTIEAHEHPCRITVHGKTVTDAHTHFVDYTVALPEDADPKQSAAESADGLVIVRVPKATKAAPTRIAVALSESTHAQPDHNEVEVSARPYTLTVAAAGIAGADLELSAEAGVLEVRGETARTGASLDRRFRLPRDADIEKATATHVDGLLTVIMPKKAAAVPQRVAIGGKGEVDAAGQEPEEGVMV